MVPERVWRAGMRKHPKPYACGMCGDTDVAKRSTVSTGRCKECHRRAYYERRDKHPLRHRIWGFKAGLKRAYNITPHDWMVMWRRQRGGCAICKEPGNWNTLHVDHDHAHCPGPYSCGKCVRELLCRRHNAGLGQFRDNVAEMRAAIKYMLRHRIRSETNGL
jgi:hypothetical protein